MAKNAKKAFSKVCNTEKWPQWATEGDAPNRRYIDFNKAMSQGGSISYTNINVSGPDTYTGVCLLFAGALLCYADGPSSVPGDC